MKRIQTNAMTRLIVVGVTAAVTGFACSQRVNTDPNASALGQSNDSGTGTGSSSGSGSGTGPGPGVTTTATPAPTETLTPTPTPTETTTATPTPTGTNTNPPGGVGLNPFIIQPPKSPNADPSAPTGFFNSGETPKIVWGATGTTAGTVDFYFSKNKGNSWSLIKSGLPLTSQWTWDLPKETVGFDADKTCKGRLKAVIKSTNPLQTKEVFYPSPICIDHQPPKLKNAKLYPETRPNAGGDPLKVSPNEKVVVTFKASDDIGFPAKPVKLYCKKPDGSQVVVVDQISENVVAESQGVFWTVPAGTECQKMILLVRDLGGKETTFTLRGVTSGDDDGGGNANCKPGLNKNDPDLLGYYCFNGDFKDASPKKNDLIPGTLEGTFNNKPLSPVKIVKDFAFGKAGEFDGRAFAVAKKLNDYPDGAKSRTIMTWVYTTPKSWLKPTGPQTLPRQNAVFNYGKAWEKDRSVGMELCCYEGCKCPTPDRPVTTINTYLWDNDVHTGLGTPASQMGIPKKGWWHYAVTIEEATKKVRVYINGKKVSDQAMGTIDTIATDLRIGTGEPAWEPGSDGKYHNGRMAHFAFLKRMLTDDEIKKTYDKTKPHKCEDGDDDEDKGYCDGVKTNVYYVPESKFESLNPADVASNDANQTFAYFENNTTEVVTRNKPAYFRNLAHTTRDWEEGFPDYTGTPMTNNDGARLKEYYSFKTIDTYIKMGDDADMTANYQFAVITDDAAIFEISGKEGSSYKKLITGGYGPPKFICASETVPLKRGELYPVRFHYQQGPRNHTAAVLLWRKNPNSCSSDTTNCGTAGYEPKYFNGSDLSAQVKNQGWQIVPSDNFRFKKSSGDSCF